MKKTVLMLVKHSNEREKHDFLNWLMEYDDIEVACALWYQNNYGPDFDKEVYEWSIEVVTSHKLLDRADFL